MNKKVLTEYIKISKLTTISENIKDNDFSGRLILIVDCNNGGIRQVQVLKTEKAEF
jgi:hypothetical protein